MSCWSVTFPTHVDYILYTIYLPDGLAEQHCCVVTFCMWLSWLLPRPALRVIVLLYVSVVEEVEEVLLHALFITRDSWLRFDQTVALVCDTA